MELDLMREKQLPPHEILDHPLSSARTALGCRNDLTFSRSIPDVGRGTIRTKLLDGDEVVQDGMVERNIGQSRLFVLEGLAGDGSAVNETTGAFTDLVQVLEEREGFERLMWRGGRAGRQKQCAE